MGIFGIFRSRKRDAPLTSAQTQFEATVEDFAQRALTVEDFDIAVERYRADLGIKDLRRCAGEPYEASVPHEWAEALIKGIRSKAFGEGMEVGG